MIRTDTYLGGERPGVWGNFWDMQINMRPAKDHLVLPKGLK